MAASEAAVTAVMEALGCRKSARLGGTRCVRHYHEPWTDRGCPVAVAAADAAVDADRASIQAETPCEVCGGGQVVVHDCAKREAAYWADWRVRAGWGEP